MSEFKINWLKDSFIPFVLIFVLGVIGILWSERSIVKSSKDYVLIPVQKIQVDDDSDSDTDEDINSMLLVPQWIGLKNNTNIQGMYQEDPNNIEVANNLLVSKIVSKDMDGIKIIRDEILKNLNMIEKETRNQKYFVILLNNLALSYKSENDETNEREFFHRSLKVKDNWFSYLGLSCAAIEKTDGFEIAQKQLRQALNLATKEEQPLLRYTFAVCLSAKKKYSESLRQLSLAIEAKNDFWAAILLQAILYRKTERYAEAENIYRHLLMAQPNLGKAHYNYAILLNKMDRPEAAIKEFQSVLLIDDNNRRARRSLAMTYFDLKQYEKARSQFLLLHRRSLRNPTFLFWLGRIELILGNKKKSEEYLKSAIEMKGGDYTDAWLRLAELMVLDNRKTEAKNILENLLRLHSDSAAVHFALAETLDPKIESEKYLSHVKNAVKFKPDSQIYRRRLASLYEDRDQADMALSELKTALEFDPNNMSTLVRTGELLTRLKNYSEANVYFIKVLQVKPLKSVVQFNYGQNLSRLGDCLKAQDAFSKALEASDRQNDEFVSKVLRQRAACYAKLNDTENAIADLNESLDLRDNYSEARVDLAEIWIKQNKIDKAKKIVVQGLALQPNSCSLLKFSLRNNFGAGQNDLDEKCKERDTTSKNIKK